MRTTRIQAMLLLATGVLCLGLTSPTRCSHDSAPPARTAAKPGGGDPEKTILETAQRFAEAFNKADAAAIAALWSEDGDYVEESGERTKGRTAIQKKYATFFADNPGAKIEITVDAIRLLGPDAAVEDGHARLTLKSQADATSEGVCRRSRPA